MKGSRIAALTIVVVCLLGRDVQSEPISLVDTIDGELSTDGQVASYEFTVDPGTRVFVDQLASNNTSRLNSDLRDRWDRVITSNLTSLTDLGPVVLVGGDYTLRVFGEGDAVGTFQFRVLAAPITVAPLTVGDVVDGEIDVPGSERHYTFSVDPGARLFLDRLASNNVGRLNWRLVDERGVEVQPWTNDLNDRGPFGVAGGNYTLSIRSEGSVTATYSFRVGFVEDGTTAIALGETVDGEIEHAGQRQFYDFDVPAATQALFDIVSTSNFTGLNWFLDDALGRRVFHGGTSLNVQGRVELMPGSYRLTLDGESGALGTYQFRIVEGTLSTSVIAVGGTAMGSIGAAESNVYEFTAPAGQVVSLDVVSATNVNRINWILRDALGREILPRTTRFADQGPFALVGGDYEIEILGEFAAEGDYEFTLVADGLSTFTGSGTAAAVGDRFTGSIETAGATESFTFTVASQQKIYFDALARSTNVTTTLFGPQSEPIFETRLLSTTSSDRGPWVLAAGTYQLDFAAGDGTTPDYDAQILAVVDQVASASPGDTLTGDFVDQVGATHSYTIDLATDTTLYFDRVGRASNLEWRLIDPAGGTVFEGFANSSSSDQGPWPLRAGEYTLVVDPQNHSQPAYEIGLFEVEDTTAPLALGDAGAFEFAGRPGGTTTFELTLAETTSVFFDVASIAGSGFAWRVVDALGRTVFEDTSVSTIWNGDAGPFALTAGTYRVVCDPTFANSPSGSVVVHLSNDVSQALSFDAAIEATVPVPGASLEYTFTAIEGQRAFFDLVTTGSAAFWRLVDPVGEEVFSRVNTTSSVSADRGPFALAAGDYTLVIAADGGATPTIEFQVLDLARDLRVTSLEVSPRSAREGFGETVSLTATVHNAGGGEPIAGTWIDRVYVSFDRTFGNADDELVGQFKRSGPLPARSDYELTLDFDTPNGDFAGEYVVFVELDARDDVNETAGEDNNVEKRFQSVLPDFFADGGRITFDLENGARFPVGTRVAISGRATAVGGNAVVLYIIDASFSTSERSFDSNFDGVVDDADDINGDGYVGTILDAEIGSVLRVDEIIARNANLFHAAVFFASDAEPLDVSARAERQVFWGPFDEDLDDDGTADFEEAVRSIRNRATATADLFTPAAIRNGRTSFNAAIAQAVDTLPSVGEVDQRIVLFLTDGEATDQADDALFRSLGDQEISFRAFQINTADVTSSLAHLTEEIGRVEGSEATARSVSNASDLLFEIVNSFRVVGVTVNGEAAHSVDAGGGFFHLVTVDQVGANPYTVEVFDASGGSFFADLTLFGFDPEEDPFDTLADVTTSMEVTYSDTSFNRRTNTLSVTAEPCNRGEFPVDGPLLMIIERLSDPSLAVANPDGVTPEGSPYFVVVDQTVVGTLEPDACAPARTLLFNNPNEVRVEFEVSWLALGNRAPVFRTVPDIDVVAGRTWNYAASADDADGHTLTYSLDVAPEGTTIDEATGEIEWATDADDVGSHAVTVVAQDGRGGSARQSFFVEVLDASVNRPPVFTSTPETRASIGGVYEYAATAFDEDDDALTFSRADGPDELTVSAAGEVEWLFALPGEDRVAVAVEDGRGGRAEQVFVLAVGVVSSNPHAPTLVGTPPTTAAVENLYFYQPSATDLDTGDALTFSFDEAPEGATVDPATGRVLWIPTADQVGSHTFTLRVEDSGGASSTQGWVVAVLDEPANRAPVIVSSPEFIATIDEGYAYLVEAIDPDAQSITYELVSAPDGMTIDADSGLIEWTPSTLGEFVVAIRAIDSEGASGRQVYTLDVSPPNLLPEITSAPVVDARVGATYRYDVEATDGNADSLAYSLSSGPVEMTIDGRSGLITWVPGSADVGDWPVVVRVEDRRGGLATQKFVVTVVEDTTLPEVEITFSHTPANLGETIRVCVRATDDGEIVALGIGVDGTPLELDERGCVDYVARDIGLVNFVASAVDSAGNTGMAKAVLQVASDVPTTAPTVTLLSPTPGGVLTAPTDIVATIVDDSPAALTWEVFFGPLDAFKLERIATGTGTVDEGVVATVDAARYANGVYRIQIIADDGKQTGGIETRLSVAGDLKIGDYAWRTVDLQIDVVGIPLSITRRYSSLDTSSGDFGAGWNLLLPGRIEDEAMESRSKQPLVALLASEPLRSGHRVYVDGPNGERFGFTFEPFGLGYPVAFLSRPFFQPDPGVRAELEAVTPAGDVMVIGGVATQIGVPYNPSRYVLTMEDGAQYTISETTGLERIEDRHGNSIDVTDDGFHHSSGISVLLERDAQGRIERVIEPDPDPDDGEDAPAIRYEYDVIGNLVRVFDQANLMSEFRYENAAYPYYLTEIIDPSGRPSLHSVYNDDGELFALCGPTGDPETLAGCSVYERDGEVVTIVTARGQRIDRVYDERGLLVLEREWRDEESFDETSYEHDGSGNIVHIEAPDGSVHRYSYDDMGRMTSATTPDSEEWTFEYGDEDCRSPEVFIDPLGNRMAFEFDEDCRVVAQVSSIGDRTVFEYTDRGSLESITDAVGNEWTYRYDARGFATTFIDPQGHETRVEFDRRGLLDSTIDANGRRTDYDHDDARRVVRETWDTDPPTVFDYDWGEDGRLRSITGPEADLHFDYFESTELKTVRTVFAGGLESTLTYGVEEDGEVTRGYDAFGLVTEITDSFGGRTTYSRDAFGALSRIAQRGVGVAEKRVDFERNSFGVIETIERFSDLSGESLVARSSYNYDCGSCSFNRLSELVHTLSDDSPIHAITVARDAALNVRARSDSEGLHEFLWDGDRRLLVASHPDSALLDDEAYAYDPVGNRTASHTSGSMAYSYEGDAGNLLLSDDTYDYQYDDMGNLTRRALKSSGAFDSFHYNHRNLLVAIERFDSDGDLLSRCEYGYDPLNRRIRSLEAGVEHFYVFDDHNPLIVLDTDGNVFTRRLYGTAVDEIYAEETAGETRWLLRDELGNTRDVIHDDGTTIAHYVYDTFGQVVATTGDAMATQILFQGREHSFATGLTQFRARSYDARSGRFTQADPLQPFGYDFARNNPIFYIDPFGLSPLIDEGQLTAKEAPSIPPKRCIGIWASKVFRLTTFLIVLYGKSQGMTGGPPRVTPPLPPPPAVAGCGPSPPDPTDAPPIPRWWTPGSPPTFNPAIYKFFN